MSFPCAILPMWINLLMSNIDRNHWITNQRGELLTNARYSTLNVNGNQGTWYILTIMNRFVVVEWAVELSFQETLMSFLRKWQGFLPLRHAGSRVPTKCFKFQTHKMFWSRWVETCWKESLNKSPIIQLSAKQKGNFF